MFGFFIMGFVDIVGIATSYVKSDFAGLSDSVVNMISLSCFLWFLVLSIPTGMLMNRIGRKNTVLLSFAVHVLAMCMPLIAYDFASVLIAFGLIGIGNTLLQVSMNPLVMEVVTKDKLTGTLTLGQFVKAVSSFVGPILAAWAAGTFFGWKMIFPIYAGASLVALLWLWLTPIRDIREKSTNISFRATFDLLRDSRIVAYFIGILVLVGVDVGMNMTFPKLLMERCGLELTDAGMGNSVYFFARTVGAFLGGILLMKYSESKFFTYSTYIALLGLVVRRGLCEPVLDHFLAVAETGSRKSQRSFGVADRRRVGRRGVAAAARRGDRPVRHAAGRRHHAGRRLAVYGLADRTNQNKSINPEIKRTDETNCNPLQFFNHAHPAVVRARSGFYENVRRAGRCRPLERNPLRAGKGSAVLIRLRRQLV